jgi:hypothetical protein
MIQLIEKIASDYIEILQKFPEISVSPVLIEKVYRSMTPKEYANAILKGTFECTESENDSETTDWTIDPEYWYSGEEEKESIRVTLDFIGLSKEIGEENVLNLLFDGESELRINVPISVRHIIRVESSKDGYEEMPGKISNFLKEHYERVYEKYGVQPIKPFGNYLKIK